MSLLNEALRKRNRELNPPHEPFPDRSAGPRSGRPKMRFFAALAVLLGMIVLLVVWFPVFPPWTQPDRERPAGMTMAARHAVGPGKSRSSLAEDSPAPVVSGPGPTVTARDTRSPGAVRQVIRKRKKEPPVDDRRKAGTALSGRMPKTGERKKRRFSRPHGQVQDRAGVSRGPEETFYRKALRYHRRNELDRAIEMYREVLRKNPEHSGALFNLASACLERSLYSEARAILCKLHERDPEDAGILVNLAIAEIGMGRPRMAVTFLDQAEKADNGPDFLVCLNKAIALSRLGRLKEAERCYKEAEKLEPAHPRLFFNMAVFYDRQKKYPDALYYYDTFLKNGRDLPASETKAVRDRMRAIMVHVARQSP
ncbi:MAG: hypothetical protein DRH37_11470 [Deltaproteobacteria bacterium]|nr:MAG: hypothetical protein DRH37_11470 [Deltaproteobacteria bacterium]